MMFKPLVYTLLVVVLAVAITMLAAVASTLTPFGLLSIILILSISGLILAVILD